MVNLCYVLTYQISVRAAVGMLQSTSVLQEWENQPNSDRQKVYNALKWNKFTILGHSMGGNVGGLFCSIFPEMVDKLILLDGYGFFPIAGTAVQEQFQRATNELIKLEKEQCSPRVYTRDAALKRLLLGNKSVSEESGKILLQRGSTEVPGGLIFTRDLRINLPTPVRITIEQCLEFQKNITAAVLLIGAEDGLWKGENWNPNKPPFSLLLEGYQTYSKQFGLEKVKGNHHVHLNEPERVAGIISEFLRMDVPSKL
ncbi:serine hydrolase-like protein isoform X2 [Heterodontus francisci]|uniref:serine hydrolase-like protein isoform X2 n=1 Tax=Heterodontus francisci TaxID=7792 RepID=UPI00355ADFC0